jgi:cbb3-type cytochrome oxidase maturation protein
MTILYFLVPVALLLAFCAVLAFRWAVRDSQFDDLESPAVRILDDEATTRRPAAQSLRYDAEERGHE